MSLGTDVVNGWEPFGWGPGTIACQNPQSVYNSPSAEAQGATGNGSRQGSSGNPQHRQDCSWRSSPQNRTAYTS
jgi:hypothetical protein